MRARRAGAVGVLGVLLAGLLTACAPELRPLLALRLGGDGRPVFVVDLCPGLGIIGITIAETRDDENPPNRRWRIVPYKTPRDDMTTPAFETPAGWARETSELTAVEGGVPYLAAAYVDGQPQNRVVHFELRNLQALKTGDVWTFDNGPDEERAMSSKDFHRRAEKSCRS